MPREALLQAAGSLRAEYEAVDWATTPLGPVASWSPALRHAVDIALHTRFPVTLLWGPELVLVYNAAYVSLISDKHPAALGAPAREVFPEAWDTIGPMLAAVLAGEGAVWIEDAPVPLHRRGRLEEAYFTFSYSPVRGDRGEVAGVMDIAIETTGPVVDERRLRLLSGLEEQLRDVHRAEDVPRCALPVLRGDAADLPAFDIRLHGESCGVGEAQLPAAPTEAVAGDVGLEPTPGGTVAWLPLSPPTPGVRQPMLAVLLSEHLAPDETYLAFLRLVAATLAHTFDRITARDAERSMSEALQRSLLSTPPRPEGVEIAVRYRPAAAQAHVGGDWYDAFVLPDDSLTVVIGDVTGHDRQAATAMAQVRNLLRGVAYTLQQPPGAVLAVVDEAMDGLAVDVYATAFVAQVEPADGAGARARTLRWSNAGHPPPVLLGPDGVARLLELAPDPLLGMVARGRADHVAVLEPGTSLILYTDGLVERRGTPLRDSLEALTDDLSGCQALTAEGLCDRLLAGLEDDVEDDVALLVLRVAE